MTDDNFLALPRPFKKILWCVIFFTLSLVAYGGYPSFSRDMGFKDDNVIEEVIEHIIEKETGISIDLTPDTKEK